MKRILTGTAVALLLCTSGAAMARPVRAQPAASAPPAPASNAAYDRAPWWMKESVITQTGFVYTEIPANRATFSATFLSVDDTADKAQAKSIAQTKALNQTLAKLGKDAVRVTTSFSMRALYEQYRDKDGNKVENQRADKINGYEVSLNMSLEVRDMSQLEKAYALVLAASPTQTEEIDFSLQPSNETNTWLYNEAIKDAHKRALEGAVSAGGQLGGIKVIDPTGRACQTDILARGAPDLPSDDNANEVVVTGERRNADMASLAMNAPPPPAVQPRITPADALEAKALANPFIQTPPLQRIEARACVVYGVN